MPQNGQTHFKNLAANAKVCLNILGHYALKGFALLEEQFYKNKSLDFSQKKFKDKLGTEPGLLSHRT